MGLRLEIFSPMHKLSVPAICMFAILGQMGPDALAAEFNWPVLRVENAGGVTNYQGSLRLKSDMAPSYVAINDRQILLNAAFNLAPNEEGLKDLTRQLPPTTQVSSAIVSADYVDLVVAACNSPLPQSSYVRNQFRVQISAILPEGCGLGGSIPIGVTALITWIDIVNLPKLQVQINWQAILESVNKYARSGEITYKEVRDMVGSELNSTVITITSEENKTDKQSDVSYTITDLICRTIFDDPKVRSSPGALDTEDVVYGLRKREAIDLSNQTYEFGGTNQVHRNLLLTATYTVNGLRQ
jgi:hypothetical protein